MCVKEFVLVRAHAHVCGVFRVDQFKQGQREDQAKLHGGISTSVEAEFNRQLSLDTTAASSPPPPPPGSAPSRGSSSSSYYPALAVSPPPPPAATAPANNIKTVSLSPTKQRHRSSMQQQKRQQRQKKKSAASDIDTTSPRPSYESPEPFLCSPRRDSDDCSVM